MRILLTGASGFVGSALSDQLTRQGHELYALMRRKSSTVNLQHAKFNPVLGDLRDPASLKHAVEGVELILHVAGVVTARNREGFFSANAGGTKNLLEAIESYNPGLKRFVFVSSLAAAGPSMPSQPKREDDSSNPISFYGESKLAAEAYVRASRIPSVIIRPPAVYGPRDRGVFTFFQMINAGVRLSIGGGVERRFSFVHVEDLVQGILAAAFSTNVFSPGEIFYIAGEGELSWDGAMDAIAKAMHKRSIKLSVPTPVLSALGGFYTGLSKVTGKDFPLSLDKVKELTAASWTCDNSKAKRMLEFTPYWDLPKGLEQTARWYRDHSWL